MKRNYVGGFKDFMLFTVESSSVMEAAHLLQGKLWADYVSNILPDFLDDGCMAVRCNLPCSNLAQTHRAWLLKSNHTLISRFPSCFETQDGSSSSQIHPTYLSFWLWWDLRQLLPSVKGETCSRVICSSTYKNTEWQGHCYILLDKGITFTFAYSADGFIQRDLGMRQSPKKSKIHSLWHSKRFFSFSFWWN